MLAPRESKSVALVAALACCFAVGCPRAGDGSRGNGRLGRSTADGWRGDAPRGIPVGNQAKGVEDQPDYDREALALRDTVEHLLPDPVPAPRAACVGMLDAARSYYATLDDSPGAPHAILDETRTADLRACEAETSPSAASCVALMLSKQAGEFPWLLDQCSRAFPK